MVVRQHPRYALKGKFPGRWTSAQGAPLDAFPVDISQYGFGLLLDPCPDPGANIFWNLQQGHDSLEFAVEWSLQVEMNQDFQEMIGLRRCGVRLIQGHENLVGT